MKFFKKIVLPTFLVISAIVVSCKKNGEAPNILPENNQWILDSMKVYYYWADQLPQRPGANTNSTDFFKSLLNSADRFSYMDDPEHPPTEYSSFGYYGFEYALIEHPAFPGRLLGTVTLVTPGGPAAKQGLRRGDLFLSVNGTEINSATADGIIHTLKQGADIVLQMTTISNGQLINGSALSISHTYFREQPVYLTKLFTNGSKKAGYIYYNGFTQEFDRNILDSIARFKSSGISDLIIDLRYNPGGDVSSAAKIAVALAPVKEGQTFIISQANKNGGQITDSFAQSINKGNSPPRTLPEVSNSRITISKLYVLTSLSTASAAELLINNLKPYLPVVQIGEKTVGKDMSGFEIYDQRTPPKITYLLHPLIFKLYNANKQGNYSQGLIPDYYIDEFSALPLKEFGDKNDLLLKKALELSLGSSLTTSSSRVTSNSEMLSRRGKAIFQSSAARSAVMSPVKATKTELKFLK